MNQQSGQSLLEAVILVGVVVIVATGLTVTVVNGLKNSQFSKNQAQATKLAQEGIEEVRAIRDRNLVVCVSNSSPVLLNWNDIFPTPTTSYTFGAISGNPTTCTINSQCSFILQTQSTTPGCSFIASTQFWLKPSITPEMLNGGLFQRQIIIEDVAGAANQKRITAKVFWQDTSGTHQSQLTTILANY